MVFGLLYNWKNDSTTNGFYDGEKLITLAKRGDVHARRRIISHLYDVQIAHKLVDELAPRLADRSGGYVRLFHLGPRRGDSAPMAQLELTCSSRTLRSKPSGSITEITSPDRARRERAPRGGVVDGDVLAALVLTAPAFVWIVARTIAHHQVFDAGVTLSAVVAGRRAILYTRWSLPIELAAWTAAWLIAVGAALRLPRHRALALIFAN